ncbi:MAG: hypothetical protein SGILL_009277 [Bacillariaceae sp.]
MPSLETSKLKVRPGHVREEEIAGVDVLYMEPAAEDGADRTTTATVKGILFVAHGCSHSKTDWFLGCDDCIGLPEERAIVALGLERNLLVVAISSSNRDSKCWNHAVDGPRIAKVLEALAARYNNAPVIAFGASSGGAFVSILGKYFRSLYSFISQIAAQHAPTDTSVKTAIYITMNRDKRTEERAQHYVETHKDPVPRVKHLRLPPLHIGDTFFSDRIIEVSTDQSKAMVQALREESMLTSEGLLSEDPRRTDWRYVLRPHVDAEQDSLIADQSPISEVMNVAYGNHELARDSVGEALDFCLSP